MNNSQIKKLSGTWEIHSKYTEIIGDNKLVICHYYVFANSDDDNCQICLCQYPKFIDVLLGPLFIVERKDEVMLDTRECILLDQYYDLSMYKTISALNNEYNFILPLYDTLLVTIASFKNSFIDKVIYNII